MARAGQRVLREDSVPQDRITVGLLAIAFPRQAVDEAIEAAGAREQRSRMLPAWLTVYFVLALALYMDMGASRVMRRLAGALERAAPGVAVAVPSEEALSNARTRLGPVPVRLLFERTAGRLAPPGTPGASWRGLRLVSLDGTALDCQDTDANRAHFGGPSARGAAGARPHGGLPRARLMVLAECATGALIAALPGAYATGDETLTAGLLPRLRPGMLALADCDAAGYQLWRDAAATGADLLWRIGVPCRLPAGETLADGTRLSALEAPRELRGAGAHDIAVRVIACRPGGDGQATKRSALITTLLDAEAAPARELADIYRARWKIETALRALTPGTKDAGLVLRSRTPLGAEQEIWALLCAYHAIREMIRAAAALAP
jgi:hypothetical protein